VFRPEHPEHPELDSVRRPPELLDDHAVLLRRQGDLPQPPGIYGVEAHVTSTFSPWPATERKSLSPSAPPSSASDHRAVRALRGESQVGPFNRQVSPLAAVLERGVADQCSWKESGFAKDLEAVADAPHQAAAIGELAYLLHHGCEARDRSGAQVIAVCKPARQDDAVAALEVRVLVPEVLKLRAEDLVDHPAAVAVRPRAREDHDSELHRRTT